MHVEVKMAEEVVVVEVEVEEAQEAEAKRRAASARKRDKFRRTDTRVAVKDGVPNVCELCGVQVAQG